MTETGDRGELDALAERDVACLVGDVDAMKEVDVAVVRGDVAKTRVGVEVGDDSPAHAIKGWRIGGGEGATLKMALDNIRIAFVQIKDALDKPA